MITKLPSSSPPSEFSGSGAPVPPGALPHRCGGREDAKQAASNGAASLRRGDQYPVVAQHVTPFGAQWNGEPGKSDPPTPSSRFFIRATIIADQLEVLRKMVDENRDVLSLGEVAQAYQLIDDARRVSLHGLKDTPVTAIGRRLDVTA